MKLNIKVTKFNRLGNAPVPIGDKDFIEKLVEVNTLRPADTDEALDIGVNICAAHGAGIYDVEVINPHDDSLVRFKKVLPQ
jgi:hypothetical protein